VGWVWLSKKRPVGAQGRICAGTGPSGVQKPGPVAVCGKRVVLAFLASSRALADASHQYRMARCQTCAQSARRQRHWWSAHGATAGNGDQRG
jgi:hypothetical protein